MTEIKGKINNIEQDLVGGDEVRVALSIRLYPKGFAIISSPKIGLDKFNLGDKVELTIKKVG